MRKVFFINSEDDNVRVLFRLPFFRYFLCKNYTLNSLVIAKKYWNGDKYRFKEI